MESHDLNCERVQLGPLTWCTCGGGLYLHERSERGKSGLRLYIGAVIFGLLIVGGYWAWQQTHPAETVDPRAGITCMDDAGGGTYCWRATPSPQQSKT